MGVSPLRLNHNHLCPKPVMLSHKLHRFIGKAQPRCCVAASMRGLILPFAAIILEKQLPHNNLKWLLATGAENSANLCILVVSYGF
jgi:hypothetical protein